MSTSPSGRLSVDEHADRLEQVWVAKTHAELVPVFRDLPGGAYGLRPAVPVAPSVRQGEPSRRRRRLPVPLFVLVPMLVVLTVLTHVPLVLFGLLAFFLLTRGGSRRHPRHSGHYGWR